MLIEGQKTFVKWNRRTVSHYMEKGYTFTKFGDSLEIDVKDLSVGSDRPVKVECDYCGKIYEKMWKKYYYFVLKHPNTNKVSCKECQSVKGKETNLDKYNAHSWKCTEEGRIISQELTKNSYDKNKEDIMKRKKFTLNSKYSVDYSFQLSNSYINRKKKLDSGTVLNVLSKRYNENMNIKEISKELKISASTVTSICNGKRYKDISVPFLKNIG